MLKTTILAAFAIIASASFANAGILDAYNPNGDGARGTYMFRSVDPLPTAGIAGETGMTSGFSILGRGQMGRTNRPLDLENGNCCGSSR